MPDHNGATLRAGDAVFWGRGRDYRAPATVLRVLGPNRYLIQFAPHDPTTASREDMLASLEELLREETDPETVDREMRFLRDQDPQQPLEVNGDQLEYAATSNE